VIERTAPVALLATTTSESPMSRRPSLALAAVVAAGLLLAPAASASAAPIPVPSAGATAGDPFYDVPSPLKPAKPGTVLRTRLAAVPLAGVAPFTTTTVLYHSRTVDGRDQIVSGTLFTPATPGTGSTLLTVAPGTQGLGPQCAPSKQFVAGAEYESAAVAAALAQGWSVAVTDYDGYVNGGAPTYVTGEAMGHAVLDMARAATHVPGSRVTSRSPVLLQGYSQGGGGAGWAASLAHQYAPELDIRGAAVGGVPADVQAVGAGLDGTPNVYFELIGVVGLDNAYPDAFRLHERLNERGRQVVAGLRSECVGGPTQLAVAGTSIADYTVDGSTMDDLAREPKIARALAGNRLADRPAPTVPVYQSHAAADEIVQLAQAQDLHRAWCAARVTTRLDLVPGEHVTGLPESLPAYNVWLRATAAGLPVVGNC
jgi:Secretory lipase